MSTVFESRAHTSYGDLKQPWESFQLIQFITQKTILLRVSHSLCVFLYWSRGKDVSMLEIDEMQMRASPVVFGADFAHVCFKTKSVNHNDGWVFSVRSNDIHSQILLIRQSCDWIAAEAISHWADEILTQNKHVMINFFVDESGEVVWSHRADKRMQLIRRFVACVFAFLLTLLSNVWNLSIARFAELWRNTSCLLINKGNRYIARSVSIFEVFARERCVPDIVWLMLRRNERTPTDGMSFPPKMQILKALQ